MKIIDRIIVIIFSLSLIFSVIWMVSIPTLKNKKFYLEQYEKGNIIEQSQLTELEEITDNILNYFFGNEELEYLVNGENIYDEEALNYFQVLKSTYILIQIVGTIGFLIVIACICYMIWRFATIKKLLIKYVGITFLLAIIFTGLYILFHILKGIPDRFNDTFFHQIQYCYYQLIYLGNMEQINSIPQDNLLLNAVYSELFLRQMFLRVIIGVIISMILCYVLMIIIQIKGRKIEDEFDKLRYESFNS